MKCQKCDRPMLQKGYIRKKPIYICEECNVFIRGGPDTEDRCF